MAKKRNTRKCCKRIVRYSLKCFVFSILCATFALSLTAVILLGEADKKIKALSNVSPSLGTSHFDLPSTSIQIAEGIYQIAETKRGDKNLTAIAILHYGNESGNNKRSTPVESQATTCYTFYATGAYWKTQEQYVVDTTNTQGLSSTLIYNSIDSGVSTWNGALSSGSIFGTRTTAITADGVDTSAPDGKNEVVFGSIAQSGVIAVTIIWGVFSGTTSSREITEWDQLYDQVDFDWGDASSDPSKMDLKNIATHELGHAAGLGDVYSSSCSEATMYGYASVGETKKRTLSSADLTGIRTLYGEIRGSSTPSRAATGEGISLSFSLPLISFSFLLTFFF